MDNLTDATSEVVDRQGDGTGGVETQAQSEQGGALDAPVVADLTQSAYAEASHAPTATTQSSSGDASGIARMAESTVLRQVVAAVPVDATSTSHLRDAGPGETVDTAQSRQAGSPVATATTSNPAGLGVARQMVDLAGQLTGNGAMDLGQHRPEVRVPDSAFIKRLQAAQASHAEWRRQALACFARGDWEEAEQILEAALTDDVGPSSSPVGDRVATMRHLVLHYVSYVLAAPWVAQGDRGSQNSLQHLLRKAKTLLDRVQASEIALGVPAGAEAFIGPGFHALSLCNLKGADINVSNEMKRAEFLFDGALKLDATSPQALIGKAMVFTHHQEWDKALGLFRQLLQRAAQTAPREGVQLQTLKHLRLALAVCFCNLGRFEQTRNALASVVAIDHEDVESLCALAHLEAKVASDGVGKSMQYLDEAARADTNHPVVLCQLANHAFYCGFEESSHSPAANGGSNGERAPWKLARSWLEKVLASAHSPAILAEGHYQLGRLSHAQGAYENARMEYQKCCSLQPDHFACLFGFAQTCVQQRAFDEAIKALEKLRKRRGDMLDVLKLLAYAYLSVGDKAKEAVGCSDAFLAKCKDDVEVWAMRAEAHDQLAQQRPDEVSLQKGIDAYEQVARLLENGDGKEHQASPQMWNNLGTLRSLHGDPDGAREAYSRGLQLIKRQLEGEGGCPANSEEAKDLQVAVLTMRFNSAWIAESLGDQPNFAQATQDYMALSEKHNWFADTVLRLGAQWQRLGEVEVAVQRYQEAMKQNPVLANLMQAEAFRQLGEYNRALQSGEMAVRCAGEKQFHYAHVYLGNLYFEVASSSKAKQKDRDSYMFKALNNFTKALEHQKDSHYAANGIGMVFAHRGKLDFARRTFQSVMQHHAMTTDPSIYVNLGHTYLRVGGDDARKAIALYERAKRMKPNDLTIRLYLAKAYFGLKEFERCLGVLGDATQIWPDDILLRYNLAVSLENFGRYLVLMEKKEKRVVGVDSGKDKMTRAVDLLTSAARLYEFVDLGWSAMSEDEQQKVAARSGAPSHLLLEMSQVEQHKEFCADIAEKAREQLDQLQQQHSHMDGIIQRISANKEQRQREAREQEEEESKRDKERMLEMEEQAIRLMDSTRDIELGKNLEAAVDKQKAKATTKPAKEKGKEKKPLPPGEEGAEAGEADEASGDEQRRGRKDKKRDKKVKKDKKTQRKDRKRGRADDEEGGEDTEQIGEATEESLAIEDAPGKAPKAGGEGEMDVDAKRKKDKKDKKEKKDRKEKKDKKEKKEKRRKYAEEEEEGSGEGVEEDEMVPTDRDKEREEELFGPDD